MPKPAKAAEPSIQTLKVKQGLATAYILGQSPFICNAMSAKARQQLLFPSAKKNAVEKATTLKHDPLTEYRDSCYKARDDKGPTRILQMASAYKGTMKSAALRMPGTKKTEIGQLTYVEGDYVHLFGVPQLLMSVTRSADIARTPDVRTRAIIPQWAAKIQVRFAEPLVKAHNVSDLLAFGGAFMGVGDWRPEKGAGAYGQFILVEANDPRWKEIIRTGGLKYQDAALERPECYDEETRELLSWFETEVHRRGFAVVGGTDHE